EQLGVAAFDPMAFDELLSDAPPRPSMQIQQEVRRPAEVLLAPPDEPPAPRIMADSIGHAPTMMHAAHQPTVVAPNPTMPAAHQPTVAAPTPRAPPKSPVIVETPVMPAHSPPRMPTGAPEVWSDDTNLETKIQQAPEPPAEPVVSFKPAAPAAPPTPSSV